MAEARDWQEWNRTSELLWLIATVNNDPKRNPKGYEPQLFHPYLRSKPKSKAQREAEALKYHLDRLAEVPEEKFDAAFERFFNRGQAHGSEREGDQGGPSRY